MIFLPTIAAPYDGIPPGKSDDASALMSTTRNTGGSFGIAIISKLLTHREQFHQSRLAQHAIPSSAQDTLNHLTSHFVAQGSLRVLRNSRRLRASGCRCRHRHRSSAT